LVSKALDNRLGAYIVLEAARRIGEAGARVDAVAVAAVQEELGTYGARAAAFGLAPDLAIVVDVTPATDVPGGNPQRAGAVELGMGAMVARGPTLNKKLSDLLAETAAGEGIAHGFEVYSRETHTDADDFHHARAGIPTGLISVPTRYVHTPNELCDLADVEAVIALIVASAARLTKEVSFLR
jgi:endoglucanase